MPKSSYSNKDLMKRSTELTYAEVAEGRKQVGGDHYSIMPVQPIDYIVKNNIPYREANAIKYITRHRNKNGAQDIEKAIHYLEMILKEYNDR